MSCVTVYYACAYERLCVCVRELLVPDIQPCSSCSFITCYIMPLCKLHLPSKINEDDYNDDICKQ